MYGYSFERYRRRWIEFGAKWGLIGKPPPDWDAALQLRRIGVDLQAERNSLVLLSDRAAFAIAEEALRKGDAVETVWPRDVLAALDHVNSVQLSGFFPYYWVDVLDCNTRAAESLVVVHGISPAGIRQIIAVEAVIPESADSWQAMFVRMRTRGMTEIPYVCSTNNSALRDALKRTFAYAVWHWSPSDFVATVAAAITDQRERLQVRRVIWQIFNAETVFETRAEIALARPFVCRTEAAAAIFENGIDSATAYCVYPKILHVFKRPGTRFAFQWFDQRLKRFRRMPPIASLLRLVAAMAIEQNEWYQEKHDVVIR